MIIFEKQSSWLKMIQHIELINEDKKILRGYLTLPNQPFRTTVVFFHGFTGNKTEHGHMFRDFSRLLAKNNIASLRMDFSGNGESDGDFSCFTFDTMEKEAKLMLDEARKMSPKIVVLGFSMGGAMAAKLAATYPHLIDQVILWSPAGNISQLVQKRYETTSKLPNGNADILNFEISKALYDSTFVFQSYDHLDDFQKPVLIIHGKNDLAVDCSVGKKYSELFVDSNFILIPKANHGYDDRESKKMLFDASLAFLKGEKI